MRDVVVVGSGVCGALIGAKLGAAGLRVTIVEAGESGQSRTELVGNYVTASVKSMGSPYKGTEADRWVPSPDGANDPYLDQPLGKTFKSTYQRRLGGSTWHWRGNVPRFVPNDFRLRSFYGVGVDWPISYTDLEAFYCDAERELGVSGNHAEWQGYLGATRSKAFPMSEIWSAYGDTVVARAIDGLVVNGVELRVMRTPQARNSQPYDGKPACAGNSTCDPICPIGAKYDATRHIDKARAAGVEVLERSVATRLVLQAGRVASVEFKRWDGSLGSVAGKVIVVAAHAVETAKLLLMSACDDAPQGVANSSDFVGRCLMDHLQGQAAALLREPVFPFRGPPTTSGIDAFRDGPHRALHSAFRMSIGNDGWGLVEGPYATLVNTVAANSETQLIGAALRATLRDRLTCQFRISYSTETLPDPENRVQLSPSTDALGLPKPRIHFRVDDYSLRAFNVGRRVISEIFRALHPREEPRFNPDPAAYSSANHILGTTRMGSDPRTSVTSAFGQSHDHPNLFIAGASLFPTCGTANPTLTAVALALRAIPRMQLTVRDVHA